MKTINAILIKDYSIGDLCNERCCCTITFKEENIVFITNIRTDDYYGKSKTYHRTICLKHYGLIEILSKNKDDLYIKGFDKENKDE